MPSTESGLPQPRRKRPGILTFTGAHERPALDRIRPVITYAFAGLQVTDYVEAYDWYLRVLGRPADMFPHATEAVWWLTSTGAIYVVEDSARAGGGLLTVAVDDLGEVETRLRQAEIAFTEIAAAQAPRRLVVEDTDGNRITFFEDPGQPG
jgi:catechol 2,3-dioxygenase-like lactoylglutathione lyase family enzyme